MGMNIATGIDVTSANAVLTLTVDTLYPSGVRLEGFSADGIIELGSDTVAEGRRGADGRAVYGKTCTLKEVTIHLEANSPSRHVIEEIAAAMEKNKQIYPVQLTALFPATNERRTFTNGSLISYQGVNATTTLQPCDAVFNFETVEVSEG